MPTRPRCPDSPGGRGANLNTFALLQRVCRTLRTITGDNAAASTAGLARSRSASLWQAVRGQDARSKQQARVDAEDFEKLKQERMILVVCLEHRRSSVRKNAVFAVYIIYHEYEYLIPDAPELMQTFIAAESDATCKRNAFVFLARSAIPKAVEWVYDQLTSPIDELLHMSIIEVTRLYCKNDTTHRHDAATTLTALTQNPAAVKVLNSRIVALESRQLLIQSIHVLAVKFSEVAASVVHALMEFLGDSNNPSALDNSPFVCEVVEKLPHLRQSFSSAKFIFSLSPINAPSTLKNTHISMEVHFREIIDLPGADTHSAVPNSSLIVACTATKFNTSRHTLNSRPVSYTEVQTVLQGRGIDLTHKCLIILQGEVKSIAQMKPEGTSEHHDGLLECLEDIIGTAVLKAPMSAFVEVVRLGEKRAENAARSRIIEEDKEKAKLDAESKEVLAWLELENEHVRALSRLWKYYLWGVLENDEQFAAQVGRNMWRRSLKTRGRMISRMCELLEKHYKECETTYEDVKAAAEEVAKDNAARENHPKIKTKKHEIAKHEMNLEKEEKVFEGMLEGDRGPRTVLVVTSILQTYPLVNFHSPQGSQNHRTPEGLLSAISSLGWAGVSPNAPGIGGYAPSARRCTSARAFRRRSQETQHEVASLPGQRLTMKVSLLRPVIVWRPRVGRNGYRGMREMVVVFKVVVFEGMSNVVGCLDWERLVDRTGVLGLGQE
ncbi:uncharacterized protein F5891DRAFT_987938 [Suillus fuscotomentosus]|uniref:Clathrin/coatomer adaptor adaptin-like N-terminal domain-containing protein n=1 Tax=Suillus fuscotomentosus TaxID=1912939 RepID=A0AAD4DPF7_9AGAM|nr:uncharacterized protein F5891DRAFT_987938 [Suillus fuscotomentosus]KAG1887982.1 hypothetical protein F5891DRAFT_987938 [Suillus fuscotomentosus]